VTRLNRQVEVLDARVRDIPLVEVMSKLGYRGEHDSNAKSSVYRDAQGRAALIITDGKATGGNEIVARNAVDLVIHVREAHERIPTTAREVTPWLAEAFGKNQAVATTLVRADQQGMAIIREHERSREMETRREPLREIPSREIERTSQREQHEGRSGFFR